MVVYAYSRDQNKNTRCSAREFRVFRNRGKYWHRTLILAEVSKAFFLVSKKWRELKNCYNFGLCFIVKSQTSFGVVISVFWYIFAGGLDSRFLLQLFFNC